MDRLDEIQNELRDAIKLSKEDLIGILKAERTKIVLEKIPKNDGNTIVEPIYIDFSAFSACLTLAQTKDSSWFSDNVYSGKKRKK